MATLSQSRLQAAPPKGTRPAYLGPSRNQTGFKSSAPYLNAAPTHAPTHAPNESHSKLQQLTKRIVVSQPQRIVISESQQSPTLK